MGGRRGARGSESLRRQKKVRESSSHTFVISRGRLRRASLMRRGEASWASSSEPGGVPPPRDPPGRLWRAPLARGATRKAPPARQSNRSPFCHRPPGGAPPWLFARASKGPLTWLFPLDPTLWELVPTWGSSSPFVGSTLKNGGSWNFRVPRAVPDLLAGRSRRIL